MRMRSMRVVLALLSCCACWNAAGADAYPSRPIRVLAGGAAGGPIDIISRVVGQKLAERLGQSIVIDNRGGAGGTIATRMTAQAVPDGYTILCNSSQFAVGATLYKDAGFDPFNDFAPIINAGVSPNILMVHPSVPATNLQEVIALIKARKIVSYASPGSGTTPHLTGERLLKTMLGLNITHVPYPSAAPAITAVVGGQMLLGSVAMPPTVPLIKGGKLRGIAVTSLQRAPSLPDVATVAEAGFANYEDYTWIAFFAPAKTPPAIVDKLNSEIATIVRLPDTHERLATLGFEATPNTPAQFSAYVKEEVTKWSKVIREAGARVD